MGSAHLGVLNSQKYVNEKKVKSNIFPDKVNVHKNVHNFSNT